MDMKTYLTLSLGDWIMEGVFVQRGTLKEEWRNEMKEENKQSLEIFKHELKEQIILEMLQRGPPISAPIQCTSEHKREQCGGSTIREDCTELVALGKTYDRGSTIHGVAYAHDILRVSVDKVINGDPEVPLLTSEIKYVRQTLDTFIAWPTPLVKLVSNELTGSTQNKVNEVVQPVNDVDVDDPLRELIKSLVDIYEKPVELVWDVTKFGIPNVPTSLFVTCTNVNEIISDVQYMDDWNNSLGQGSMYGFLEPQAILNAKDRRGESQQYIEKWLKGHWQLFVLFPTNNLVMWFFSLHRKLDVHIKVAIKNAFKTLKMTYEGKFDETTPRWIEVKSHVQSGGYECDYYVMHWMWNIIGWELKTDWTLWFAEGMPLDINTITTLWKKWT
ncbi:hypothetical protein HKD37_01G000260 [Glycine soja]